MSLIYISQNRIPSDKGYAIQIMKMCEAFAISDIDIKLFVLTYENNKKNKKDLFDFFNIKKEFPVYDIETPFIIRLGKIGYIIQGLFFSLKILFTQSISLKDIIYTRDWIPSIIFSLLGYKVYFEIHTHHGSVGSIFAEKLSSGIIVISKGLKDFYIEKGFAENKIFIAPSGVDIDDFSEIGEKKDIRQELGLDKDIKIALYTGHLYEWKGIDTMINASKYIGENIKIVCIGGTEYDIERIKKDPRLFKNKNIYFLGSKPFKDIALYMRSADVFLLPNSNKSIISERFTSPLKLFTYMAMRKPIIISDLPAMREIVDDNMVYFFESENEKSLIEKIKLGIENKIESDRKINIAYNKVTDYSWINRANRLLSFIGYTEGNKI